MSFEGNYYEACKRIAEMEVALRQIRGIAPLGIDTYAECYHRIQRIAGDALGIVPVASQASGSGGT